MTPNVKVSPTGGGRKLPAAAAAAPETQKVSPEKRKEEKGVCVCVCEGGKRWWWCGWKGEDRGGRSPVPNSVRKFLSVPSSLFLSLSLSRREPASLSLRSFLSPFLRLLWGGLTYFLEVLLYPRASASASAERRMTRFSPSKTE